jgi:acyl carrier protein
MSTLSELKSLLAEQLAVVESEVVPSASLVEDLGADQLDQLEIAMQVEENFGIEASDEEITGWKTVGDIIKTIDGKKK